jgi:hypothetical protein
MNPNRPQNIALLAVQFGRVARRSVVESSGYNRKGRFKLFGWKSLDGGNSLNPFALNVRRRGEHRAFALIHRCFKEVMLPSGLSEVMGRRNAPAPHFLKFGVPAMENSGRALLLRACRKSEAIPTRSALPTTSCKSLGMRIRASRRPNPADRRYS